MQMVMRNGKTVPLIRPFDYTPSIEEIAYGLSRKTRFGSQSDYTVAQHSVHVSSLLPFGLKFSGLMHDAHEVYTGDVQTPHKELFRLYSDFYDKFEYEWAARIRKYFQLPVELHPDVKLADSKAMSIEIGSLMPPDAVLAFFRLGYQPDYSERIEVWSPEESRIRFIEHVSMYSQFIHFGDTV